MAERDILTADEARQFLGRGVTDTTYGGALALGISAVSKRLDVAVGPVVIGTVGTIIGELHSAAGPCVWLKKSPVYSVTQVVEYTDTTAGTLTAESNTSKPAAGYHIDLTNGRLTRRDSGVSASFPCGLDNISVSYICGRYTATTAVDERYKFAAGMMLKANWRMFETAAAAMGEFDIPHASFPTFSVPKAVKEMLADEWRTGLGV